MSKPIFVLGRSGSGKSSAVASLNPQETFLINVIGKDLPWRGAKKQYQEIKDKKGNMFTSDSYEAINKLFTFIDNDRKEIKHIIIDDSQYLIVNEFMKNHSSKGAGNAIFQLYNEIGDHFWNIVWQAKLLREDLFVFFLHHTDLEPETGKIKAKTIGKMLDEKVDLCGMFTYCLHAKYDTSTKAHVFETNTDGTSPAKTPKGMFDTLTIPNDLQLVVNTINNYEKGE